MTINAREAILLASEKHLPQSQGYNGLNFRDLAAQVGIKPATYLLPLPQQG